MKKKSHEKLVKMLAVLVIRGGEHTIREREGKRKELKGSTQGKRETSGRKRTFPVNIFKVTM